MPKPRQFASVATHRCRLANGTEIELPQVAIHEPPKGATYKALKDYKGLMAVFRGERCLGHISVHSLGYTSVTAWQMAQVAAKRKRRGDT